MTDRIDPLLLSSDPVLQAKVAEAKLLAMSLVEALALVNTGGTPVEVKIQQKIMEEMAELYREYGQNLLEDTEDTVDFASTGFTSLQSTVDALVLRVQSEYAEELAEEGVNAGSV